MKLNNVIDFLFRLIFMHRSQICVGIRKKKTNYVVTKENNLQKAGYSAVLI